MHFAGLARGDQVTEFFVLKGNGGLFGMHMFAAAGQPDRKMAPVGGCMGQEFSWVQGAMRCAPSASRADAHFMNPGEALRRSRLDDHKGVFTGLPKGGGDAPRPSDWQFGQGIGRDDQIGRHITWQFAEVGSQGPCPLQGRCSPWAARLPASFRNF